MSVSLAELLREPTSTLVRMSVALGVGLLIGAERERRKQQQSSPAAAGIRTFAVASLTGAVSLHLGGVVALAVTVAATAVLAAMSYWRTRDDLDPGITTEFALILTVLLGGLSMHRPDVAAAVGVVVASLLAMRTPLHRFVVSVLTEREISDALTLAGATLIVLPLLPDRTFGPFGALNPRSIWVVVVLVLTIGAAGHVAVRMVGAKFGLPLAGLISGFVSSAATIGDMGARARRAPTLLPATVAGAVLSTVATILQMAILIAATSASTLRAMAPSLVFAGVAAVSYGVLFTARALRAPPDDAASSEGAFSLGSALIFAATLSVVLLASAALRARFGLEGAVVAAAVAGLVDAHAAAIAISALVAAGKMPPSEAVIPILAGLSTNTLTKLALALSTGGRRFVVPVAPGLLLVAAAAWAGTLVAPP